MQGGAFGNAKASAENAKLPAAGDFGKRRMVHPSLHEGTGKSGEAEGAGRGTEEVADNAAYFSRGTEKQLKVENQ